MLVMIVAPPGAGVFVWSTAQSYDTALAAGFQLTSAVAVVTFVEVRPVGARQSGAAITLTV